jgi:hypothetical protein
VIPHAVLAGYLAGLVIALLTYAAEHSRIAFGGYALYGNGALIVPVILAPFALYLGWVWLLSQPGDRRLECALYTVGLHFGVGMNAVLPVFLGPQPSAATPADLLPGFLLSGAFFVLPAALVAAGTLWLVRSGRLSIAPLSAAFAMVIAGLTVPLFGFGLGILSGGAVALGLERPERRVAITVALLALLVIVGNALIVAAIVTTS